MAAAWLVATEAGTLISTDEQDLTCCAGPSLYPRLIQVLEEARLGSI
jgi:hypothetical protein